MANSVQRAKIVSTPSEMIKTNELTGRVRISSRCMIASAEQSTITMFSIKCCCAKIVIRFSFL